MACDHCRSIDLAKLVNRDKVLHHATFKELAACVSETGCQLCGWIKCDIEKESGRDGTQSSLYNGKRIICYIPSIFSPNYMKVESWRGNSEVWFEVEGYPNGSFVGIELFVERGSKLADSKIISARPIASCANDEICFELAQKWRDLCLEKHGNSCLSGGTNPLPTRVIDVGLIDGICEPCLKEPKNEKGQWVALSHCWGTQSRFVTDSGNILARKSLIRLEDMPPTFRDAVIVTRRLGYRYLWIDSLCIVQNDHDEWVAESIMMRDYYKYAVITISADSAWGDHVGFLDAQRAAPDSMNFTLTSGEGISARKTIECPNFRNRSTFISKRAWTLQEFVLATRSLLYTQEQLVWECHTRKYCESDENSQDDDEMEQWGGLKRFFSTPSIGKAILPEASHCFEPSYRWYSLVNDYARRDLTYRSDILPAISGLAREIKNQTGNTYAAGVWLEDIHIGLIWSTYGAGKPSKAYYAPSWSWASLTLSTVLINHHEVYLHDFFFNRNEVIRFRVLLLGQEVILKDNDPFGCVSSGFICLRGKSLLARQWQGKTKTHFNSYHESPKSHYYHRGSTDIKPQGLDQMICNFDTIDEDTLLEELLGKTTMFQISTWNWEEAGIVTYALLLLRIEDEHPETYRRVGIAEVPNINGLAEENWEMKDVCII